MARIADKLTDIGIKALRSRPRAYRVSDGRGLYLEVSVTGAKLWRLKYRIAGKEGRLSFGLYGAKPPLVSLAEARKRADRARHDISEGLDPAREKAKGKAAGRLRLSADNTFGALANEWHAFKSQRWSSASAVRIRARLDGDVLPSLGRLPMGDVTPMDFLLVLRRIEARGSIETAHRVCGYLSEISRYGIATGRMATDPADTLQAVLGAVVKGHMASVTDPEAFGALLRLTDNYPGGFVVACALKLAPRLFVRPGELRTMKWVDIDLDGARWDFTASKTTGRLVVPLAPQCVEILRELRAVTGAGPYALPNDRSARRPMSENGVTVALRSLGIAKETMSGHGFRASARTILDEVLGFPSTVIELQLGHRVKDSLKGAYDRTTRLPERVAMMSRWANYLDEIKAGALTGAK